jgi:pyruvate-formate lyase-activating enzyme
MLKLDEKTLATTVTYRGQEVWSQVVFAEKALHLAKRAGIETMRNSLTGVHDNLLAVFKEKISGSVASWEKFCMEIKAVNIEQCMVYTLRSTSNPQCHSSITHQMSRMKITTGPN